MNIVLFLGILLILGLLATRVSKKINFPNVTAFLVIGIVIGVICLLIDQTGYLDVDGHKLSEDLTKMNSFISTVALGFIAMSIGEEFKLSKIKQYGSKIIIITLLQALLAVILVDASLLLACYFLGLNPSIAICLGAIATATAPAATIMVIHQYKAKGELVDILLPVVAFDDAIGLIVFAISLAIGRIFISTETVSLINVLVIPLIEIIGSIALGFLLGLLLHIFIKFFQSRNNHMICLIAFTLLGVGCCTALNLIKINGQSLDFSSLLTCMMIGAVYVNLTKEDDKPIVTRDLELMDRWTPFLFTLFFVLSGASLVINGYSIFSSGSNNLIVSAFIILGVYLVFRSLGKYFGAYFGCKITKHDEKCRKYLGFTLLPQAGVAIGMANQISQIEVFQKDNIGTLIVTVVLCATLVYELVGPSITKWALTKAGEIEKEI